VHISILPDHTAANWWGDLGTVLHTVRGVGGPRISMLARSARHENVSVRRGSGAPSSDGLEHHYIPHTYEYTHL
jgi:hypothetical protein